MREHIVGLGCNLCGQQLRIGSIVAVESGTDEEEQGRHRDKQITTEESRETSVTIGLGGMVALHVVLVNTIVLEVDEDSIDEAHPEGRLRQVKRELT